MIKQVLGEQGLPLPGGIVQMQLSFPDTILKKKNSIYIVNENSKETDTN